MKSGRKRSLLEAMAERTGVIGRADPLQTRHYEIRQRIGAGGFGEVYRAQDTKLKRDAAIKLLPEELSANPSRITRLEREAQMLAAINHPHIATIYGLEESGGVRFLVMELAEGRTLSERLDAEPLELEYALNVARQIAEAIEAAHEQSIIHRDLKPATSSSRRTVTSRYWISGSRRGYFARLLWRARSRRAPRSLPGAVQSSEPPRTCRPSSFAEIPWTSERISSPSASSFVKY